MNAIQVWKISKATVRPTVFYSNENLTKINISLVSKRSRGQHLLQAQQRCTPMQIIIGCWQAFVTLCTVAVPEIILEAGQNSWTERHFTDSVGAFDWWMLDVLNLSGRVPKWSLEQPDLSIRLTVLVKQFEVIIWGTSEQKCLWFV